MNQFNLLDAACPVCGAPSGESCRGVSSPGAVHGARIEVFTTPPTKPTVVEVVNRAAELFKRMDPSFGFIILGFEFDEAEDMGTVYASNAKRDDALRLLREFVKNMEAHCV